MIYSLYAIRDVKVGFLTPTAEVNDDVAARNFYHAVSTSEGILFTCSSDFDLYRLASYDADSGRVIPEDIPVLVAQGSNALKVMRKESKDDG